MKKIIIFVVIILILSTTAMAWSWNKTKDTTFTVLKEPTSLDLYDDKLEWERISVFHDNDRNATCWISQSRFGEGVSCLYDKERI